MRSFFFFFAVLRKLARENAHSSPKDKDFNELFCRCNVALQKYEEHALALRWLDAKAFLREWHVAKARREWIEKGFSMTANHSIESCYRLETRPCLLSFYIEEDSFSISMHETEKRNHGVHQCLPCNAGLTVSLNFLMAMYIARPQFIYQCIRKTHALPTVASTIIAEFAALNLRQNAHTGAAARIMHFPIAKCLFLTNFRNEWNGTLTFRPLPEPLRSVLNARNQQSWATSPLTQLQLSTIVNIYLASLVEPTSALGATIADLKLLTKSLFAAAVYSAGSLTSVLAENLSTMPASFVREAIEEILMNTRCTDTTLLMVCKVIQQLASGFPVVREAFLATLGHSSWYILHFYKAIANSFSGQKDQEMRAESTERTRLQALLTLLFKICEATVLAAEHSSEEKMRGMKLRALLRIESHLIWLLVKLSRLPQLPLLAKSWKQLHLCISGIRLQKSVSVMDVSLTSTGSAPSSVLVCSCGGVRISDFSKWHRLVSLVNTCRCRQPAWIVPEFPDVLEWMSWEMYFESCVAVTEKSDGSSDSIPEGNRMWNGWAQGLNAKLGQNLNSGVDEVVQLIFHGVLQSRVICLQTFKTASLEDFLRIPRHIKALLRSMTSTSCFSSVSWLYTILKRVVDATALCDAEQEVTKETMNNAALPLLFKQCIESLLKALPRRHLFPLCADGIVPISEVQSAEWGLGFLFAGRNELEECVTAFPAIACYTGHIGNMSGASHVDAAQFPRLAMLCTYVNAYEHRTETVANVEQIGLTKARVIRTFYLFDDDGSVLNEDAA